MERAAAPFFAEAAEGPEGGFAQWVRAADGTALRVAAWPLSGAGKGTVFLLPGRTEYVEKYGRAAADLHRRGFGVVSIDWRGQGMSPRPLSDPMTGHVGDFAEYQRDMAALIGFARGAGLAEPFYLLAHSMGGCIGLRQLMGAHPFQAAAFSAPMWGILIAAWMRPMAIALANASRWFHFDHRYAPGTKPRTYVLDAPFAGNSLTTDQPMWDYMREQAQRHPELTLGGPSLGWLQAALSECHALGQMSSPDVPCQVGLGTCERIVDVAPIHARMARWPKGALVQYPGAEHEIMMETPAARARFFDAVAAHFTAHSGQG